MPEHYWALVPELLSHCALRPLKSLKLSRRSMERPVPGDPGDNPNVQHGQRWPALQSLCAVRITGPGHAVTPRRDKNISVAPKIFSREGLENIRAGDTLVRLARSDAWPRPAEWVSGVKLYSWSSSGWGEKSFSRLNFKWGFDWGGSRWKDKQVWEAWLFC